MNKLFLLGLLLLSSSTFIYSQEELSEQEIEETIKICNRELLKKPNDELYLMGRADALMIKGEYKSAIGDYIKLSSINNDKVVNYKIGRAFLELEKYEPAIRNLSIAIGLDSLYFEAILDRGNAYYSMKSYEKALDDFIYVSKKSKSLKNSANLNTGLTYFYLDKYDESEEFLNKVLVIEPKDLYANFHLSTINLKKGNIKKMCNYYSMIKKKEVVNFSKEDKTIFDRIKKQCK